MADATMLGKASPGERKKQLARLAAATFGSSSSRPGGLFARICHAWAQPICWSTPIPEWLRNRVAYTEREEEIIAQLRGLANVPYDAEDSSHERALRQLFASVKSSAEADDLLPGKDPRWKELGFQSDDPRTDFRGGGLFALHNVVFLAEAYPERTQQMIRQAKPATSSGSGIAEYLFAAACINISVILVLLLGFNTSPSMRPVASMPCPANIVLRKKFARLLAARTAQQSDIEGGSAVPMLIVREVFGELFSASVNKLHVEWRALCMKKPDATLLDFGEALRGTVVAIEAFLGGSMSPDDSRSLSLMLEPLQKVDPSRWQTHCRIQLVRLLGHAIELACRMFAVAVQLLQELRIVKQSSDA